MNTAFIGLDYTFDITHPDSPVARSAAQISARNVIAKTNAALKIAEEKGWLIILVKVGFAAGYPELPQKSPIFSRLKDLGRMQLGTPGTEFHPELIVPEQAVIITKPRVSAFYATTLEAILRANHIDRLVLAGVSTTWAIQSTAREGHDRDYEIVVVEDASAAASEEEHQASIKTLTGIARIVQLSDLNDL